MSINALNVLADLPRIISTRETELYIARACGGTHSGGSLDIYGPGPACRPGEVKSQIYEGLDLFKGRGKYSHMSVSIHNKKISRNEKVFHTGFMPNGDLVYAMSYDFIDIADEYLRQINVRDSGDGVYHDCTIFPRHFMYSDSFRLHYVHDNLDQYPLSPGFYKFLHQYTAESITPLSRAFDDLSTTPKPHTIFDTLFSYNEEEMF